METEQDMKPSAWLCTAALLASASLARAEDSRLEAKSEADRKTVAVMESLKISLNFSETSLEEVVSFVREVTQLNILVSKGVVDKGDEPTVTLKVDELKLSNALALILDMIDLSFKLEEGVIVIVTKEETKADVYLELYDVRDLLFHLRDFKAPEISLAPVEDGTTVGIMTSEGEDSGGSLEDPTLLVELIKTHTCGTSWTDNPKCSVDIQNGILIVVQSKEGHKQVTSLVEKLRQYK